MHGSGHMRTVNRLPSTYADRPRGLAEVETIAWLLDNSIPVPGTGRRLGIDALIGFIPVVGDVVSGGIGLFVVWRASRFGLPRVVVARMLVNSVIDIAIGAIPLIGDAFDLWFKANTRNLAILRRHLIDKVPVSDLCDEYRLQPTVFYAWQRTFFEDGAAFERKGKSAPTEDQRTIAALREKLRRKDEVVSELMEEHLRLKKSLGGP